MCSLKKISRIYIFSCVFDGAIFSRFSYFKITNDLCVFTFFSKCSYSLFPPEIILNNILVRMFSFFFLEIWFFLLFCSFLFVYVVLKDSLFLTPLKLFIALYFFFIFLFPSSTFFFLYFFFTVLFFVLLFHTLFFLSFTVFVDLLSF